MRLRNQLYQNRVGALFSIVATVSAGLLFGELDFSLATSLKYGSYDLPFVIRNEVAHRGTESHELPDDLVLVYLDDSSHQELKQPYSAPWDRRLHAQLLDRMTEEGARAVVFDVVFTDPSPQDPEADQAFAQAIERNGRVILAADLIRTQAGTQDTPMEELIVPYEMFDERCAEIGFSALHQHSDLEVRQHFHYTSVNEFFESLSWATARFLESDVTKDDLNRKQSLWVNYYGPPRTLPHYSFHEVIRKNALPGTPFKDKIVYVGAHLKTYGSGERKDEFLHPWSSWGLPTEFGRFMAGVEVQSTILLNLLRQDWLQRISVKNELLILITSGLLLGGVLVMLRPIWASLFAISAALIITLIATYIHWQHRLWFPWALIVAVQIPLALVISIVFNSVKLYVQKQLLEQSIRAYLSPKLVKAFANRPDENFLKPGAKKQQLSILFSDIEGFTSLSEGMDSSELANLMNGYFETTVSNGIHATDGTVVKYIGDAIFAFWNAPEPQSDHATRACEAAIQIQNQPYEFSEDKPITTRVGIHTGSADVGNFGSENRVDYTAIGENINLASRLEGLNKYLGTKILISNETREAAAASIHTRDLGFFRLKGFEKTVHVLEVIGMGNSPVETAGTETFQQGLQAFQTQDFASAEEAFSATLESSPGDGPSKFYLKQIERMRAEAPPADWRGEVELDEK